MRNIKEYLKSIHFNVKEGRDKGQKKGSVADIYAEKNKNIYTYFILIDDGNVPDIGYVIHIYSEGFEYKIFEGWVESLSELNTVLTTLGLVDRKKTASIDLDHIKCSDGWMELGNNIGFSNDEVRSQIEYGEFGNITIEVDQEWNIVGGKVHKNGK